MEGINRYPRGFTTRQEFGGAPNDNVEAHAGVEQLMSIYRSGQANADSWKFQSVVIATASRVFGNFRTWLVLQLSGNDNVHGLNLRFLQDTVQFIRTGHRITSVQNWEELLAEYPEAIPGTAGIQRVEALNLNDIKEFDNFIGQWCSWEGGFEDMICTMHVLFGSSKTALKTRPF